jgi:hypothetical protein
MVESGKSYSWFACPALLHLVVQFHYEQMCGGQIIGSDMVHIITQTACSLLLGMCVSATCVGVATGNQSRWP